MTKEGSYLMNRLTEVVTATPPTDHPKTAQAYQRAAEAYHCWLRNRALERGCFPITIAFTHGSASLRRAGIPLTLHLRKNLGPLSEKIAKANRQELTRVETNCLIVDGKVIPSLRFLEEADALWFLTQQNATMGHLFGALKVAKATRESQSLWAVFDTNSADLEEVFFARTFSFYYFNQVLFRATLHHREVEPFAIFGFENQKRN